MKRFKISVGFAEAINCWLSPSPKKTKGIGEKGNVGKAEKNTRERHSLWSWVFARWQK